MTDDIYVGHQKKSNAGCLLAVIAIAALVAGIAYLAWNRSGRKAEPGEVRVPEQTAQPASIDRGLSLLAATTQLRKEDKLVEARDKAYDVLDQSSNKTARAGAELLLGEVNVELVLSPRMMPEKMEYTVQPGDSLAGLAKKNGTTMDVVRKGNRITGSVIRVGDRMRIFTGRFSIRVSKSDNTLVLLMNDKFFKRYAVGTGEYGRTPVGTFSIRERITQPTWWRPDGKAIPYGDTYNVLGTHWLSLDIPGYGIHGTWQPETIGKQSSAGCIRLVNAEIEELFTLVPEGTPVTITD